METIRSFIAIEPDPPARAWLEGWLGTLRERGGGVRWVRKENLHLTLRFRGEVPADRTDGVAAILAARARPVPPAPREFDAPGTFGPRRSPRTSNFCCTRFP